MLSANIERVFITGLGAVSALGLGYSSLVQSLKKPEPRFALCPEEWAALAGNQRSYIAQLPQNAQDEISKFETVSTDRSCTMAMSAASQAWLQANGDTCNPESRYQYGVYWGTGMAGLHTIETQVVARLYNERKPVRPMTVLRVMSNAAAAQISIKYDLRGPNQTITNACASSAIAIGEAFHAMRHGRMSMMMVGGSEAMLVPGVMTCWSALRVLSTQKNAPTVEQASKPFSSQRCGLVMGEGAAAFVLETESHMRTRGAQPLAEIVGYASMSDASSLVHPDVNGQVMTMNAALADARLNADQIDNINAHATATEIGDIEEAQAIAQVFHQQRKQPIVSATKSMHGHLLGAAAAIESAICVASLQEHLIAPTLGSDPRDLACQHLEIRHQAEHAPQLKYIMSNSFAFGGSNACLIFKSVHEDH